LGWWRNGFLLPAAHSGMKLPAAHSGISKQLLQLDHEWVAVHAEAEFQIDALQFEQAFTA
jgi:hypothetical protein